MTKSNHTPGPWCKAEANTTIPIKAANGKTVASVRYGENDDSDANLIAAAPELLAALKDALQTFEAIEKVPPRSLLTAINKAEGK